MRMITKCFAFKQGATQSVALRAASLVLVASACLPVWAGPTPLGPSASQSHAAPMTNADIMSLTAAGIDADIIVSKIRSAPSTAFDTSVDALKALKAAGVANDVILNMVTGGAPAKPESPIPGASPSGIIDLKEPVLKEGLWEERTSTTMYPGDPPSEDVQLSCHSHAQDHADFQRLKTGGSEGSHGSSHGGVRLSDNADVKCVLTSAAMVNQKETIEQRCQTHGITMTMKMDWTMVDEDHMHSEAAIVYSPPIAGMSHLNTVTELAFKGPCPAGVKPGDTVDDSVPSYQKKSRKAH